MKQGQQNDDRDWNAYQPEKDVAHVRLRLAGSHSAVFFPADDSPPRPITELPALDRGARCSSMGRSAAGYPGIAV